jgi:hypothetical protein
MGFLEKTILAFDEFLLENRNQAVTYLTVKITNLKYFRFQMKN